MGIFFFSSDPKASFEYKNIDNMHFLSLFSCSKCGFTAGGKKKAPTSFPKIDKNICWHLFHFFDFIFCLNFIFCFFYFVFHLFMFFCFLFNFNICLFGIRLSVFVF